MKAKLLLLLIVAGACKKLDVEPNLILVDMAIISAQTVTTITGATITADVLVESSDECEKYSRFDVYSRSSMVHEVRAKASYPAPATNPVCAQVSKRSTEKLSFNVQDKGEHTVQYYNGDVLLKTDKVVVN